MMRVMRTNRLLAATALLAGCVPRDEAPPAEGATTEVVAEPLCEIRYGDESEAKARLELQGRVGGISLYSERGGLLCSEPAGLRGDCQVVRGKEVVVAQAGKPDARIEALSAEVYMNYGPEGVSCAPPPPAVR